MTIDNIKTVDIKPGVSVLAVLRHLNYRPWFALGEFVDNAVESFLRNRVSLEKVHGGKFKLQVNIDIDAAAPARISIRDNAAGISDDEYGRAFRPAAIPRDRSGLAEFGMGMKSAACWFSPRWSVRTSALGESTCRTVRFDIENIVNDDITELVVDTIEEKAEHHFTEIILEDVFHLPVKRTLGKLKQHLTDIYRIFIRDGLLELYFNGEKLTYKEIKVLQATFFREQDGSIQTWRKNIDFDFGNNLSVKGFAALRETASTTEAGFSLFRRGRVIQGSGDEGYRPHYIFGPSNSFRYQRLFGELHLEGFDVSHTKDGFRWDENELPFLQLLKEHLDDEYMPLLKQAEGYRVREPEKNLGPVAKKVIDNTTRVMERHLPEALSQIIDSQPVDTTTIELTHESTLARRELNIHFRNEKWCINVELTFDPSESQWLKFSDTPELTNRTRKLSIQVSMVHPFMIRFAQKDEQKIEGLVRLATAIAIAETAARKAGVDMAGSIRHNVNDILKDALSEP